MSQMEAGPELDALVAPVIGWELLDRKAKGWGDGPPVYRTTDPEAPTFQGFSPSTDMAHAWRVVEKLNLSVIRSEDGWYAIAPEDIEHGNVRGTSFPRLSLIGREYEHWEAHATAPLAICLAALGVSSAPSERNPQ